MFSLCSIKIARDNATTATECVTYSSSDSDSEPEPEVKVERDEPRKRKKKKSQKKKNKKNGVKDAEVGATAGY
jgi:hypothetical protein